MEFQNTRTSDLRSASKTKRKNSKHVQNLENTLRIPLSPTFFRYYATFFEIFWIAPKGPPFICFDIWQHNGCQKIPKDPPFYIFRHCDTVRKSHFLIFLGKFLKSSKGPPFNFFHSLQLAAVLQILKGPPFTFLSLIYSADFDRSRLVSFSADNLTLNGPLFYNLLFICSTNFLTSRRSWVRFSH